MINRDEERSSGRERENAREDVARQPVSEREDTSRRAEALFPEEERTQHHRRWESIQASFVDDPRRAVQEADSLVAELTQTIQRSFDEHRQRLESAWSQGNQASTEDLRLALQQYRAYFTRLLSI